jgi:hypothetical protein
MIDRTKISYRRIAAEGVAIVLSILLAFAIDAAWDKHKDRQQERALLSALAADFADARVLIDEAIVAHQRYRASARRLLAIIEQEAPRDDWTAIDSLLNDVFLNAKTTEIPNGSLTALFASGKLDLIENARLRSLLAAWPSFLDNAIEDQRWILNDVQQRLTPYLNGRIHVRNSYQHSGSLSAVDAMLKETVPPRPPTDHEALWDDREFDNLVSNRLANEVYALHEIMVLARELDNIIEQIDAELQRH